ncbi:hypothetical protein PaecuDRAFT_3725 [Paenibacillus curdlanolyticus YK9]|uniref:Uncharacterized protein n=1 Tax=Paenibacillus curdlanolyticus YK9 TaxID=717606 RepID=E0ICW1_9BACL|nr:hypothetical protein PaecuDRAFT_3725 [Paenibacillus curdlanolyticus YK9]
MNFVWSTAIIQFLFGIVPVALIVFGIIYSRRKKRPHRS